MANKRITSAAMLTVTAVITGLNVTLIGQLAAALEPRRCMPPCPQGGGRAWRRVL